MPTPATQTNVTDLAAARRAYDAAMAWEPGQRFLDPQRDACQDRARSDLNAAYIAAETPRERIKRLHREAADLDAQSERFMAEEASLAGRIAHCLLPREGQTEPRNAEQAAMLEGQRAAVLRCANSAADAAFGLKLEAAGIIAQEDLRAHLTGSVRSIGGIGR